MREAVSPGHPRHLSLQLHPVRHEGQSWSSPPLIHPNTHTPIPQDSPRSSLSHLFLGGQQVLGNQVAQVLPSLQEALSHPVRGTKKRWDAQLRQQPLREEGTPPTMGSSKVTDTYCGSCPASEANGTLRKQEGEQVSQNSKYLSLHPLSHTPSPIFSHSVSRVSFGARVSRKSQPRCTL